MDFYLSLPDVVPGGGDDEEVFFRLVLLQVQCAEQDFLALIL